MDGQNQNQTVSQSHTEEKEQKSKKERVKATFSILDRVVKAYNEGETYVKRGLTLFGLGSLIAGISFGAGQQISQQEVNTAKDLNNNSTAEVQSTPKPVINHTAPTPPPSVIYVTPVPSQHNFIPTHTPIPVAKPAPVENATLQPVSNAAPTSQSSTIKINSSVQPAPQPISEPVVNSPVQPAPQPISKPQSSTTPPSPEVQPVVTQPPIIDRPESINPESITSVLSDVQQAVEPLQQVSGIFSGLKQTVEPWTEESDDD